MHWLLQLLGGGLFEKIDDLVKTIFGDKEARNSAIASEQQAVIAALAAEFQRATKPRFIDSLADGLNRLPRPLIAFAVIGVLIYAPIDPIGFSLAMQAYSLVPEWLALLFGQIILLYFGGRMLDKWNGRMKAPSLSEVQSLTQGLSAIAALRPKPQGEVFAPMPEADYRAAMERPEPLPDDAIREWNRRQGNASGNPSIAAWRAKGRDR